MCRLGGRYLSRTKEAPALRKAWEGRRLPQTLTWASFTSSVRSKSQELGPEVGPTHVLSPINHGISSTI